MREAKSILAGGRAGEGDCRMGVEVLWSRVVLYSVEGFCKGSSEDFIQLVEGGSCSARAAVVASALGGV